MRDTARVVAGPSHGGPATWGLWGGIDSQPADHLAVIQGDLPDGDLSACRAQLSELTARLLDEGFAPGFGVPDDRPTYLIGMSARLLKGEWSPWRDDCGDSARWGKEVRCPSSLRMMAAKRDWEFPAFRSDELRSGHETDIVVLLESADSAALVPACEAVAAQLVRARWHRGDLRPEGRGPFGFHDGTSNLQDVRRTDPQRYEDYLLHREEDLGVEGTHLAFRHYRVYPERMSAQVTIPDDRGGPTRVLTPEQIIGRCQTCGSVLDAEGGHHLPRQFDEEQGARAYQQSHLYKANPRGRGTTNFGHDIVPPDARMLRRSYPTSDPEGLLFLSFQADIQHGGFEFIHNEWLMSDFNGAPDPLLTPEAGLVEPTTGCYYFIPRRQDRVDEVLRVLCEAEPRF